jgi:mycothiol synthase
VIRTATFADLERLRALLVRANEAPYDLGAAAEEKCFGGGIAGAPAVRIHGDCEGVAVSNGRHLRILAVAPEARRRGIGTALLADAEARGVRVVGAEAGNYFTPGVWEGDAGAVAFFRARGYGEKAATWNLDVALHDVGGGTRFQPPVNDEVGTTDVAGAQVRRAAGGEAPRVLSFIEEHFGRIWRFEAARAFDFDPVRMFVTNDLSGFAVHDVNNRGLGFFGPTGVIAAMRGRGLGCALLRASLGDLARLGYGRAVIPWTDALDFYRKCCGAEPAHRFLTFAR